MNRVASKQVRGLRLRKKPLPETCLFCDLVLSTRLNLRQHLYQHTQELPYFCKYCNATFRHVWSKTNHENNIHLGIKHRCSECSVNFNNQVGLRNHMKRRHASQLTKENGVGDEGEGTTAIIEGPAISRSTCKPREPPPQEMMTFGPCPVPVKLLQKIDEETVVKNVEDKIKMKQPPPPPPPLRLFGLPVTLPVREKVKWDPMFFLHMNRYKVEDAVDEVEAVVSKEPPRGNSQVSKRGSRGQVIKLVGISKVGKRRQSKRLLVKSSAISDGARMDSGQ